MAIAVRISEFAEPRNDRRDGSENRFERFAIMLRRREVQVLRKGLVEVRQLRIVVVPNTRILENVFDDRFQQGARERQRTGGITIGSSEGKVPDSVDFPR